MLGSVHSVGESEGEASTSSGNLASLQIVAVIGLIVNWITLNIFFLVLFKLSQLFWTL